MSMLEVASHNCLLKSYLASSYHGKTLTQVTFTVSPLVVYCVAENFVDNGLYGMVMLNVVSSMWTQDMRSNFYLVRFCLIYAVLLKWLILLLLMGRGALLMDFFFLLISNIKNIINFKEMNLFSLVCTFILQGIFSLAPWKFCLIQF